MGEICAISRLAFEDIYKQLGVRNLIERGESFYNDDIPKVLEDLQKAGVVTENEGALCVFPLENSARAEQPPLLVRKSDGGFNYGSTDVTALWHRIFKEKGDWILYVTDKGQARHFEGVFDAATRAKWINAGETPKVDHVSFGMVLGEDGKRFRTRSGEVVRLGDLLEEAKSRCREQLVAEKAGRASDEFSDAEVEVLSQQIGASAVKYWDLK